MMASFADLIDEIDKRYSPGPKAPQLVQETYRWVMEQNGGAEGLLERCGAAGLAAEVASWVDGLAPVPLSGQEVEQTLGSDTLGAFAEKTGLNPNFVRTILGYALPEIIMLAKSGAAPPEIPVLNADEPAVPLSPSPAEPFSREDTAPMQAGDRIFLPAPAPRAPPRFKKFATSGSVLALALLGLAWAGWHFSGGPASRESAGRTEAHMAEDISALKTSVEALRAAQSQSQTDATTLADLRSRLDAAKSETAASIAEVAGKVAQLRDSETKVSQLSDRLDRLEHQIAGPVATGPGAAPLQGAASARKAAQMAAAFPRPPAFDPSQDSGGPGSRRNRPQLITNWVVRAVYDGIALVEGPHGSIEVAPGEPIPGAGTVISIERRGAGWIVITNRGLVDSAPGGFPPRDQPRF
jgi:YidB-like protein